MALAQYTELLFNRNMQAGPRTANYRSHETV